MKNRIKQIRNDSHLTMEQFGNRIGITKSSVSLLESGKNSPSEQTLKLICQEFNVREEWIRDGILPIYNKRDGSFTELLSDLDDSDDDFIKNLIKVYMGLDQDSKDALRKIADGMAEKYKGRG